MYEIEVTVTASTPTEIQSDRQLAACLAASTWVYRDFAQALPRRNRDAPSQSLLSNCSCQSFELLIGIYSSEVAIWPAVSSRANLPDRRSPIAEHRALKQPETVLVQT